MCYRLVPADYVLPLIVYFFILKDTIKRNFPSYISEHIKTTHLFVALFQPHFM